MREQALGEVYRIENYIDTFAPGHYARVLEAEEVQTGRLIALKVMRPEHLSADATPRWEARAFINEADLLLRLAPSQATVRFYDCGFISAPTERPNGGEIVTLGTNVSAFRENLYPYIAKKLATLSDTRTAAPASKPVLPDETEHTQQQAAPANRRGYRSRAAIC